MADMPPLPRSSYGCPNCGLATMPSGVCTACGGLERDKAIAWLCQDGGIHFDLALPGPTSPVVEAWLAEVKRRMVMAMRAELNRN
jgi:hypothetical protein